MYGYENRDSTLVVNGKFRFVGSVDTADIRVLALEQFHTIIILENGKISVNMAEPNSAKGTPMNNELSKYQAELSAIIDAAQEEHAKIEKNQNEDDETRQKQADKTTKFYNAKIDTLCTNVFNANKNNVLGAFVLLNTSYYLEPEKLNLLYSQAGDIVRRDRELQKIIKINAKAIQTAEGKPFTDFTIENGNLDGSKVSFSDYVGKGKYVLVDFWASWCGPCIAEIPVILEVYNKYKGDKFDVLGVAVMDKREATLKSIERYNTPWSQILDGGDIHNTLYGIRGIPYIILFSPDGTIVARDLRGDRLKAKVEEVMCDCN